MLIDGSDKELKTVLNKRGYHFNTDTDTEVVALLCKYVWDSQPTKRLNFTELIKTVIKELVCPFLFSSTISVGVDFAQVGSFAFVLKSTPLPGAPVSSRRGSPLLIGVKTDRKLKVDFVDVELASDERSKTCFVVSHGSSNYFLSGRCPPWRPPKCPKCLPPRRQLYRTKDPPLPISRLS